MGTTNASRWRDLQHHIARAGELAERVPWADDDSHAAVADLLTCVNEMLAIRMAYLDVEAFGEAYVLETIRRYHQQHDRGPTVAELAEMLDYSAVHVAYLVEFLRSRLRIAREYTAEGDRFIPVEVVRAAAAAAVR